MISSQPQPYNINSRSSRSNNHHKDNQNIRDDCVAGGGIHVGHGGRRGGLGGVGFITGWFWLIISISGGTMGVMAKTGMQQNKSHPGEIPTTKTITAAQPQRGLHHSDNLSEECASAMELVHTNPTFTEAEERRLNTFNETLLQKEWTVLNEEFCIPETTTTTTQQQQPDTFLCRADISMVVGGDDEFKTTCESGGGIIVPVTHAIQCSMTNGDDSSSSGTIRWSITDLSCVSDQCTTDEMLEEKYVLTDNAIETLNGYYQQSNGDSANTMVCHEELPTPENEPTTPGDGNDGAVPPPTSPTTTGNIVPNSGGSLPSWWFTSEGRMVYLILWTLVAIM